MDDLKSNYVATFLSHLNDEMLKVRVVGNVIEKGEDFVIIDDGTAAVRVRYNKDVVRELDGIDIGNVVFIFGKLIRVGAEILIFADFARIAEGFDLKKYRKVMEEISK